MKKILGIKNWYHFFLGGVLFLTGTLYGQEIIKSSTALANMYIVYFGSMTSTDRNTIANSLLKVCNNNRQPSARYHCWYNTNDCTAKFTDYRDTTVKFDTSTTRMTIMFDAAYSSVVTPLITSGKIKKIGTLYSTKYDEVKGRKNLDGVTFVKDIDYPIEYNNKDWCLWKYIVDTSTPIK
jgi:hypothetical protein